MPNPLSHVPDSWGTLNDERRQKIYENYKHGEYTISELSQEFNVSYDSLRSGLRRMRDSQSSEFKDKKHDKSDLEIHRLRQEITELRRRDKQSKNEKIGTDAIISAIKESLPRLNPDSIVEPVDLSKPAREQHIALLSDIHVGAVVDADSTGGLSEYNYDIFIERLQNYERGIVSVKSKLYNNIGVNHLDIFALGDLVEGMGEIFEGQVWVLENHVMDQVLDLSKELANLLVRLSYHYSTITWFNQVGNHGRTGRKKISVPVTNNFDYMVGKIIETMTEDILDAEGNRRITFHHPTAQWTLVQRMGYRFLLTHGDTIKQHLGMPWYGATRKEQGFQSMLQARLPQDYGGSAFDYMCMGHFHQAAMVPTNSGEIIFNGSFPGGNEFSQNVLTGNNAPVQWLFSVNEKHGITGRWLLNLENKDIAPYVHVHGDE